jgi:hypothetical protein
VFHNILKIHIFAVGYVVIYIYTYICLNRILHEDSDGVYLSVYI